MLVNLSHNNMTVEMRAAQIISNKVSKNCSFIINESKISKNIEIQTSVYCVRCQCHNTETPARTKCRAVKIWRSLPSAGLIIGLLLIQQVAQLSAMTLQNGVPGAGGRSAGDPAPGRSPGPPLMLNHSVNFQRLTVSPDSTRTVASHRPEISVNKRDQALLSDISEGSGITKSYNRYQTSTVGMLSSSYYREDVTPEYTKATLGVDDYSAPVTKFNGNIRSKSSGHYARGSDNGHTIPMPRTTKQDLDKLDEADYDSKSWHQGDILGTMDDDHNRAMLEENPTIILSSDSDDSISFPTSIDFLSYDEEEANNETVSWCGSDMKTDINLAASQWAGLINVTVEHPLFRTDYGLVRGITYEVVVSRSTTAESIKDVFLVSEMDGRPYGRFISIWTDEMCPGAEWSVIGQLDRKTSVTFNWSADVTSTNEIRRANVTFRLRFRAGTSKAVIETQQSFPLLEDCQLFLWPTRANVSWRVLPRQTKDCQVFFPGSSASETDPRGLVVELTRLNVPCPAGGFLQFSSSSFRQGNSSTSQKPSAHSMRSRYQQLCGKLEELPPSGRRLYFPAPPLSSSARPSLRLHGNPIFAFTYRLVDYCYNVTLTLRNDTLILRPTAGLHCTFRIHLPYGNRVSLHVQTGEGRLLASEDSGYHTLEHHSVIPQGHLAGAVSEDTTLTQLSYSDPDPPCPGLLTRLWDGVSTWAHCTKKGDTRHDIRMLSRGNSVTLKVVIHQAPQQNNLDASHFPALKLLYRAEPIIEVVEQCGFGWVSTRQFCITAVEDLRLPWNEAEKECGRRGGHLASIRSEQMQDLVDTLLLNSPGYRDHNAYWVGASDKTYEGDFRWSDGLPFSYTNWFPGWSQHNHFNRQPNDDGYSEQDCVELRRVYHLSSSNERLTHSFMWNDRDCTTPNLFLCERLRPGATMEEVPECNRSVTLSREQPRSTVVSPGFPHPYPDNAKCDSEITAPPGYRLVLDFEELVLEEEPHCSYDYLEIFEGVPGSNSSGVATRRLCGDWSSKLKLLRYVSRGPRLLLRFVSDYSHHYGGLKAKVSMENGMECADDRLQMFNSSCYLFVSYPEVTWQTAQQICQGMKAELASIHSAEEENFLTGNIRDSAEYSTSAIYWLGGQLVAKSIDHWEWADGSPLTFSAWLPGQTPADAEVSDSSSSYTPMCLAIQWMPSPSPAHPSGLYWQSHHCSAVGGYVCKRGNQVSGSDLQLNTTINGTEGFLTSPNFPGNYYHNLDYWVQLIGPERSRIVVQFKQLDLELQTECLYDFVELRSIERDGQLLNDAVRWCGNHYPGTDRFNFVSASNKAVLRFHSDYSVAGAGFSATWQAVDISGCPMQTLTAREGTLVSPNFPHFLITHLDCATTILAPAGRRIWLQFLHFDLGPQHHNGRDLQLGEQAFSEAVLEIDLSGENRSFQPYQVPGHLTDGAYVSEGERLQVRLRTADKPKGTGFKAIYRTVGQVHEERLVDLSNVTVGTLLHLNYPKPPPPHVEFMQHLLAPVGHVILLELYHMTLAEGRHCPGGAGVIEVTDNYADTNGTWWFLCEVITRPGGRLGSSTLAITSYFNTLYIKQKSGTSGVQLNATVKVYPDNSYRIKLVRGSEESTVESCYPNPCLNGGKCVSRGSDRTCQCTSHFTGMFCALTLCDTQPCAFGQCKLTPTSYTCTCLPNYTGSNCEQKLRPCADNPCEGRGECFERGDTFQCRCHAWWEGQRCEKRMLHIPFKPLSERMLHEPFWLGLIAVTVVLGVIGLFWCAKRHFPEKLEKLLDEEPDRNRTGYSSHSRPPSVREQLAAAGGATVVVVPSPQPGGPRSLFGRLGIRKPSLLSLTSPHSHNNHPTAASATARTFSLDDLLKPPPRRTPSPRKKRNNSTPTKKNIAEKKQILQQLITPSANHQHQRKVSLGELIQLSERKVKEVDKGKEGEADGEETETTFSTAMSDSQSAPSTVALSSADAKMEKKVTFARLLSKVSAEMSSGSEVEGNHTRHPQLSGLPRSNSTPPSPAGDARSPHSTSSNQGSDSMSSLDASLTLAGGGQMVIDLLANRRPNRLLQQNGRPVKNPSADSILAMFRNFSSATSGSAIHKMSPSTTPTASSPQDDAAGSDESSTSSVPTPMSSSSFTLDSPPLPHPFHRHNHSNTIEVPVLDALSAHKTVGGGSNLLQPPTILLEIPSGGINKCLSPIREVPTPLATPAPSPAITPIMPRSAPPYLRSRDDQINSAATSEQVQLPFITITNSDDDDEEEDGEEVVAIEVTDEVSKCESYLTASAAPDEHEVTKSIQLQLPFKMNVFPPPICNSLGPALVVDDDEASAGGDNSEECSGGEAGCCESEPLHSRPVIPLLTIQQPSPTHHVPSVNLLGSPPPQRSGHMETNFPFPGKNQRRLLKELDKPNSLDLPCPPPLITITCNMSEAESDTESISPAAKTGGTHPGVSGGSVGMCYLSPFSMCSRADRTASESNLSSSGYSSMASPGPSRCGSNNPLCPSEVEDPPGSSSVCSPGTTVPPGHSLIQRKPSPLLCTPVNPTCLTQSEEEAKTPPEDHGLQGSHCRGRSDSETLSDDLFLESNDEGISTDHLDEKIEDGELKSAKELEVFIGKELLENGKTLLGLPLLSASPVTKCSSVDTGLDCCKLLAPTSIHSTKSSLQLPAIVVQTDPGSCEKHLSPVSSRSESPLSDKTGGLGRFSPLFYGRHKSDQLPFTDSDGLYDCPSSDCPLNRLQPSTTVQQHRKSTGRRRERRSASRGGGGNKTPSPTKITFLDVPGKEQCYRSTAPRKPSPKRSRTRTQPCVSSSSSSDSLTSTRETTLRSSSEKTVNPDRVSWPSTLTGQRDLDWGNDSKGHISVEASGEDTGEEVTSHMLPKIMAHEDLPKPHRKVSRLKTIGHQIRFLRRLELSLKRRERLVSPSDSCGEEDDDDAEGSPQSLSPLLSHKTNSFSQLHQPAPRSGRGHQRGATAKQRHAGGAELRFPPEDRAWCHVHVTGCSNHND